jgi:hypothetical protein
VYKSSYFNATLPTLNVKQKHLPFELLNFLKNIKKAALDPVVAKELKWL